MIDVNCYPAGLRWFHKQSVLLLKRENSFYFLVRRDALCNLGIWSCFVCLFFVFPRRERTVFDLDFGHRHVVRSLVTPDLRPALTTEASLGKKSCCERGSVWGCLASLPMTTTDPAASSCSRPTAACTTAVMVGTAASLWVKGQLSKTLTAAEHRLKITDPMRLVGKDIWFLCITKYKKLQSPFTPCILKFSPSPSTLQSISRDQNKSMIIDRSILYFSPSGNSNIPLLYLKKTKNIPLAKNTKSSN